MILSSRKREKANKDTETWENVRLYIQMLNETKLEEQKHRYPALGCFEQLRCLNTVSFKSGNYAILFSWLRKTLELFNFLRDLEIVILCHN